MSVLPTQTGLFRELSNNFNPILHGQIEHDEVFVEKEEEEASQQAMELHKGSDVDLLQMRALSQNQIPNVLITEEDRVAPEEQNEPLNALDEAEITQANENAILAKIKEPLLESELPKVLEEKKPNFSLSRVCQKITATFSGFLSLFSFKRATTQENRKETREVNEVQIVKVEERKVEQSSENLAKILEKLPKSLLDKLNQLQDEKKIKEAFLKASIRYEAVIHSSARKYSNLTLEQKTDFALQEGARVISNALNALK